MESETKMTLIEEWDSIDSKYDINTGEKIYTILEVDYDLANEEKPIYLEISDTLDNGEVMQLLTMALSLEQALKLSSELLAMVELKR